MKVSNNLLFLLIILNIFSLSYAQPSQTWQTGQTTCYDPQHGGETVNCSNTGEDGDIQAGVAWPKPRFLNNGNGTVTDLLTGLIWLKNAKCGGPMDWNHALTYCNKLYSGVCGLTDGSAAGDWRLPNRKELFSLACFSSETDEKDDFFDNLDTPNNSYWSSTTSAGDTSDAWVVGIKGSIHSIDKMGAYSIWPVRGAQNGTINPDPNHKPVPKTAPWIPLLLLDH